VPLGQPVARSGAGARGAAPFDAGASACAYAAPDVTDRGAPTRVGGFEFRQLLGEFHALCVEPRQPFCNSLSFLG